MNEMLGKWSKILFFVFGGIFLTSQSFYQYFFFDMLAHYSVYALILAFVLCLIYNLAVRKQTKKNILYLLPLFIIPYIVYQKMGYFYFGENEKNEEANMKIISINIFSQNKEFQYLKSYLSKEKADVLVLLELTPKWQENISFIKAEYPYYKEEARANNFGIGLYSKIPFDTIITKNYIDIMHPSLIGNLKINGKPITILATHPVPPLPNQARFEQRNKQYQLIKKDIDEIDNKNIVLIGDLNSTVYSPNFSLIKSNKMKDARTGFGLNNSWNVFIPIFRTNIDQCWVSNNIGIVDFYRGDNIKSDHFPIVTKLKVK